MNHTLYEDIVKAALREDLGRAGDLTTDAIVDPNTSAKGQIIFRKAGVVAGLEVALHAFRLLDPEVRCSVRTKDGEWAEADSVIATIQGKARALLTAERVALNFLGQLSGVATATHDLVQRVAPHKAKIADTRKTTPGLRGLEKYAVKLGGGSNHRFGLDDAVLIKDNHRAIAGGVTAAIRKAKQHTGHLHKIEVEVEDLAQLEEALTEGVDAILLDNMTPAMMKEAVTRTAGRCLLEASGGINPTNIAEVAATGVDLISVGWITHSAPATDVSLEIEILT